MENYQDLPDNGFLIFVDSVGLHSNEAIRFLKDKGFKYLANMVGGIVDWERQKLPVKINNEYRLIGSCMCQLKPGKG